MRLMPETTITVIERCSGHGGSWGVQKDNFEVALKKGKPVVKEAVAIGNQYLVSECPLAATHIVQGMENIETEKSVVETVSHPIVLFARAYGLFE